MNVITTQNLYTGKVMNLCQTHFDANANGDAQVQHGLHPGACDVCNSPEVEHDADDTSVRET